MPGFWCEVFDLECPEKKEDRACDDCIAKHGAWQKIGIDIIDGADIA